MGRQIDYAKAARQQLVRSAIHQQREEVPFSGRVPDEVLIEAEWPDGITLGVLRTPDDRIVYGRWDATTRSWTYRLQEWQHERIHEYWLLRRGEVLADDH